MQLLFHSTVQELNKELDSKLQLCSMPTFEDLYPEHDPGFEMLPPMVRPELSAPAVILHSSGKFTCEYLFNTFI